MDRAAEPHPAWMRAPVSSVLVPLGMMRAPPARRRINAAVDHVVEELGSIDILVNNAGLGANHPALEVTEADWDEMMAVNLKGLFFCCQAAARHMLAKGRGRIINMSSQASLVGIADHAVYCAPRAV
jgi:NAD(P)-dependent dehydrogenase (short-subunit alcohol dehydrogenase family)